MADFYICIRRCADARLSNLLAWEVGGQRMADYRKQMTENGEFFVMLKNEA
jgi:hypothetical protein